MCISIEMHVKVVSIEAYLATFFMQCQVSCQHVPYGVKRSPQRLFHMMWLSVCRDLAVGLTIGLRRLCFLRVDERIAYFD